jgi:hypothetical protein
MTHTKPILALSLLGAGVAALLVGFHVQRDRFAFTSKTAPGSSEPAAAARRTTNPPATRVAANRERAPFHASTRLERDSAIPTVTIEALPVLPLSAPARQPKTVPENAGELQNPSCNPKWRSLESGPIGRIFRDICPAPGSVPRS